MISVPSRRRPLSGNRWLFVIIAFIAWSCSPKIHPVTVVPVKEAENPKNNQPAAIPVKPFAPKVSTISLLLPFDLDHLRSGSPYTSVSLREADISVDYYRGFKLALDSLTAAGYNFKLVVYDSKGEVSQAHSLANNPAIRASDLIVGPVFPDDIKAFTSSYANARQPIVSPLSPAPPATYKNPKVVTMLPPLEYHAWGAARYINDHLDPKVIFILKSGYSDENEYIIPFRKAIDSLGKKHIRMVTLTVIHGQLTSLLPQLSATQKNVFLVPSTNQHFLTVTLRALDTLNNTYPVTLFGHPAWINFSFLKPDLLQRLDTHITSADHIDYKAATIASFTRIYRQAYHAMATGYAIKGFDEGLYLGKLLGTDSLANISQAGFTGLHNDFHFKKRAGLGWINTHINVYKYANFELEKEE